MDRIGEKILCEVDQLFRQTSHVYVAALSCRGGLTGAENSQLGETHPCWSANNGLRPMLVNTGEMR